MSPHCVSSLEHLWYCRRHEIVVTKTKNIAQISTEERNPAEVAQGEVCYAVLLDRGELQPSSDISHEVKVRTSR